MTSPPPPRPGVTSDLTPDSPEITEFATRMYDAARAGDVPTFQTALPAGLPPNMTNSKGDSLLMLASYHGHLPLTSLLLSHGADPNRLNDRGQSPLAGAVFKAEDAIVECLLEAGADVDAGRPSAMESVEIFGQRERWGWKFEEQRERVRRKREEESNGDMEKGRGT